MPKLQVICCAVLALSGLVRPGNAQMRVQGVVIDDTMRKKVKINSLHATTDDALLELSRAADLNFIADASTFPKPPTEELVPATDGEAQQDGFLNIVLKVANQQKLTWRRSDAQTFLFWSDPDITRMAKEILQSKAGPAMHTAFDETALETDLADYLHKQPNGNPENEAPNKRIIIKISDLPLTLQSRFIGATQARALTSDRMQFHTMWFQDAFWKEATLGIHQMNDNHKTKWVLDIGGHLDGLGDDGTRRLGSRMGFAVMDSPTGK